MWKASFFPNSIISMNIWVPKRSPVQNDDFMFWRGADISLDDVRINGQSSVLVELRSVLIFYWIHEYDIAS